MSLYIRNMSPSRKTKVKSFPIALTFEKPFAFRFLSQMASDAESIPIHDIIEAEIKWTPFYRRYFQMDFLEWKYMNFD